MFKSLTLSLLLSTLACSETLSTSGECSFQGISVFGATSCRVTYPGNPNYYAAAIAQGSFMLLRDGFHISDSTFAAQSTFDLTNPGHALAEDTSDFSLLFSGQTRAGFVLISGFGNCLIQNSNAVSALTFGFPVGGSLLDCSGTPKSALFPITLDGPFHVYADVYALLYQTNMGPTFSQANTSLDLTMRFFEHDQITPVAVTLTPEPVPFFLVLCALALVGVCSRSNRFCLNSVQASKSTRVTQLPPD